jgi:hypothetical protein
VKQHRKSLQHTCNQEWVNSQLRNAVMSYWRPGEGWEDTIKWHEIFAIVKLIIIMAFKMQRQYRGPGEPLEWKKGYLQKRHCVSRQSKIDRPAIEFRLIKEENHACRRHIRKVKINHFVGKKFHPLSPNHPFTHPFTHSTSQCLLSSYLDHTLQVDHFRGKYYNLWVCGFIFQNTRHLL